MPTLDPQAFRPSSVFDRFTVVDHRGGVFFTEDVEAALDRETFFRIADVGIQQEPVSDYLRGLFARCRSFVFCEATLVSPRFVEVRSREGALSNAIDSVLRPGRPVVSIFTTMERFPDWVARAAYSAPKDADFALLNRNESRTIYRIGGYFGQEAV